jgi:hypothetical protein
MINHVIHKRDPILFVAEILFFLAFAILIFLSEYSHKWVFDDAFMFVRYARNILDAKGYVWNPGGPRIDGLTSPLWLLAVIYSLKVFHVTPAFYESMLYSLSFISGVLLIIVLYYTVKRLLPKPFLFLAPLFTIIVFISPFGIPYHSGNGMETNMAAALLALYLFFLIEMSRSPVSLYQSLSLGILGFACVLCRPELAVIILLSPFLLWFKLHRSGARGRESMIVLFSTGGLLLLYALFRLIYFREIFPNPFYVKGSLWFSPYEDFNIKEKTRLLHIPVFYFKEGLLFHLVVFSGLLQKRNWKNLFWLWGPLYLSIFYISTTLQIMGYSYRYFFPFTGGIIYLMILSWGDALLGLKALSDGNSRFSARVFLVVVFLFLIGMGAGYVDLYLNFRAENKENKDSLLEFFHKLPPGVSVAATEVGRLSAYNPHLIIHDLSGLNDPEFRHGFIADDLFKRHPDIIAFVHDHYEGMIGQIKNHPEFSQYLRALNMLPDAANISFGTGIYINIDSPKAKKILEVMRNDKNLNRMIASQGGRVGFYFPHFPPILNSRGYHPLLGSLLGTGNPEICRESLKVEACDPFSLLMGSGWAPPETWANIGCVRAMDGSRGLLFLPLDSPSTTTVSLSFYPYKVNHPPRLKVNLVCNNSDVLDEYQSHSGLNIHKWIIFGHILKKGINNLVLAPNRTVSPQAIDPENLDSRQLSLWLYSLEFSLENGRISETFQIEE